MIFTYFIHLFTIRNIYTYCMKCNSDHLYDTQLLSNKKSACEIKKPSSQCTCHRSHGYYWLHIYLVYILFFISFAIHYYTLHNIDYARDSLSNIGNTESGASCNIWYISSKISY